MSYSQHLKLRANRLVRVLFLALCRFGLYVLASNILLNARADQWPGMCIVSFVGYAVSEYTLALGNEASSILAACAISVSGKATATFNAILKCGYAVPGKRLIQHCGQYCDSGVTISSMLSDRLQTTLLPTLQGNGP